MRLLLFFALILTAWPASATSVIRYNISLEFFDPKQDYYLSILRLALEKSEPKFGPYILVEQTIEQMPQGRTLEMLALGEDVDVHWSMTSPKREHMLLPIYIPLLKGLMGQRIFIIKRSSLNDFANLNGPSDLKYLKAGSGSDWPDTQILKDNGFEVVEGLARSLLPMLKRGRFDYYPRAIHEPWSEITNEPTLMVEPRFILRYPAAMYFFVNKENHALAERLTYGLELAIKDGSFDAIFNHHPITHNILEKAKLGQRESLWLETPNVTQNTQAVFNQAHLVLYPIKK